MSATAPATLADRRRIAEASGKRAAEIAVSRRAQTKRPHHGSLRAQRHDRVAGHRRLHQRTDSPHRYRRPRRCSRSTSRPSTNSAASVPVLLNLKPSGAHYMEALPPRRRPARSAARTRCLILDLDASHVSVAAPSATPSPQREEIPGQDVIRTLAVAAQSNEGAMAVLHGNLAPRSAVIKQSAASPHLMRHTGRAVVFDSHRRPDRAASTFPISTSPPTTSSSCATPAPKARPACPKPAICPSPSSSRARASKTWCASPTPA